MKKIRNCLVWLIVFALIILYIISKHKRLKESFPILSIKIIYI